MNVKELTFEFTKELPEREYTDAIVVHHSGIVDNNGNPVDVDLGAARIHEMHLNNGWAGIGYHFVIRKDGTIETGRPVDTIGSQTYGENSHTVGIHVAGTFMNGLVPTEEQVIALGQLIKFLCDRYELPVDREHVTGHRDWNATICPGEGLYDMLDGIVEAVATVK